MGRLWKHNTMSYLDNRPSQSNTTYTNKHNNNNNNTSRRAINACTTFHFVDQTGRNRRGSLASAEENWLQDINV